MQGCAVGKATACIHVFTYSELSSDQFPVLKSKVSILTPFSSSSSPELVYSFVSSGLKCRGRLLREYCLYLMDPIKM